MTPYRAVADWWRVSRDSATGTPKLIDRIRTGERLGLPFLLLVISAVLLVGWILNKDKRWSAHSTLLVAFLAVMAVGIPLASNTFSAFWSLYSMATILVCIGLPTPSLVTSVRKVRAWIYTFVAVAFYVGLWAVFHGGYGPSGAAGGQDENYVTAMMGMAVSFSYFSIFAAQRRIAKIVLACSLPVFLGAMLFAQNVSRGGFLGMCAVFLYCLARSPRRSTGIIVIAVIIALVLPLAPAGYWNEIRSISNTDEGTADMRLEIWKIGLRMWQANPILGVGAGNFRWMVGVYESQEQFDKFGRDLGASIIAHSLFVELIAELGTAGAVVFVLLVWRTFRMLGEVIRKGQMRPGPSAVAHDAAALCCYADAVMGAVIACLVNGAFLSILYYSYVWLFVMLGRAIWQVSRSQVYATEAA
jgi:O-antigen ligase